MPHVNGVWQIDYAELGCEHVSGMKDVYLHLIDDNSRYILVTSLYIPRLSTSSTSWRVAS